MKSRYLIAGAALAALAVPFATSQVIAQAAQTVAGKPVIGAWGVDLSGQDTTITSHSQ